MITIIDYNAGNVFSVTNALEKIGVKYEITNNKSKITKAEKIIFPGVGNAKYAMEQLIKLDLIEVIRNFKNPFLGICLGMQLLFENSEEGNAKCLGIIKGKIKKFKTRNLELKIPHMGWNDVSCRDALQCVSTELTNNKYFYFVHSYYAPVGNYTIAKCNYINDFSAIVKKDNFYGFQFHPEKSGGDGLELLINFVKI